MIKKGKNGKGAYVAVSKKIKGKKEKLRRAQQLGVAKKRRSIGSKTMAQKGRTPLKKKSKPLTPAEKRRMQQMGAKATTATAKASAARMDKRIAAIKKEK
tara:strand:- start:1031 stop:1330 length:300 start_codon:yes stop_codon:yes gene_type:complete